MSQKQIVNLDSWKEIHCQCGGKAKKTSVKYKNYEVRGWKCGKCGEEYIHPEDSVKISQIEKLKKGVSVVVGQLGASRIIRIPKEFVDIYSLEKGEQVQLVPETLHALEINIS